MKFRYCQRKDVVTRVASSPQGMCKALSHQPQAHVRAQKQTSAPSSKLCLPCGALRTCSQRVGAGWARQPVWTTRRGAGPAAHGKHVIATWEPPEVDARNGLATQADAWTILQELEHEHLKLLRRNGTDERDHLQCRATDRWGSCLQSKDSFRWLPAEQGTDGAADCWNRSPAS